MTISVLSEKQKEIMTWAFREDTREKYNSIICDGAVRTGKTICMIVAFVLWAMRFFNGQTFGICGKTVASAERNIIRPLQEQADITNFFKLKYNRSTHMLSVQGLGLKNDFFVFGGKDESSYMLVQGITLSGVFFDEVALMPRSFVEQAIARTLSVPEAKMWFNCNPESPDHWFYKEWVLKTEQRRALHIHMLMQDNPILTKEAIERAEREYQGVFRLRYILGQWCKAEGRIYPMFDENCIAENVERTFSRYVISIDYGIQNPTAMLLWGLNDGVWYQIREFYHSGRETGRQKTDEEYYRDLEQLAGQMAVEKVIIDPSASSFIALIRQKRRFRVQTADNDVIAGIQATAAALQQGKIRVCKSCKRTIDEYGLYVWDEKSRQDKPVKENDHAMDATRYFVKTMNIMKPKSDYKPLWN